MNPDDYRTILEDTTAALLQRLDPQQKQQALDNAITKRYGRGGPDQYAPARDRQRAIKRHQAQEHLDDGLALYGAEKPSMDIAPLLVEMKRRARQAPGPESAWLARAGKPLNAESYLQLQMLWEMRLQRLTPELRAMPPSAMLARYTDALGDASDQLNAATIVVVEQLHGNGWSGVAPGVADAGAIKGLTKAIRQAQDARIGEDLRQLEAALVNARVVVDKAKRLHQIDPIDPASRAFYERDLDRDLVIAE